MPLLAEEVLVGEDASKVGFDYKHMMGIRQDEVRQMLSITLDGYHEIKAQEKAFHEAVLACKQKYTAVERRQMPQPENFLSSEKEIEDLVPQTMVNIKQTLGDETYARIDKRTRSTYGHRPQNA